MDEEVLANWNPQPEGNRKRGGQVQYSDQSIECLLMLKAVYRLPYRQTIGCAQSLLNLLDADVRVPDYSLLCKRSEELDVALPTSQADEPQHIVLESTGLKIYGEREWKVGQHGFRKRRTWRKLHLSVNEDTQELQAVVLTETDVDAAEAGKKLMDDTPGAIKAVGVMGPTTSVSLTRRQPNVGFQQINVPPRRAAKIWQHGNSKKAPLPRDETLRQIRRVH